MKPLLLALACWPLYGQCADILEWHEYRKLRYSSPYIVRIGDKLLLFGARHTSDPQDPQLRELERLWREFRPQVAFSEGGIRPPAPSREEAVRRYGEPGLLRFLAGRDKVPIRDAEPPNRVEAALMLQEFVPKQVKILYLFRYLANDGDLPAALRLVEQRWGLSGPPQTAEEIRRMFPQWTGGRADPEWFNPDRNDSFLNAVARRSGYHRDCHMVTLFIQTAKSGQLAFIVLGSSHAVKQERALRAFIPEK